MAKGKDVRVRAFFECTSCVRRSVNQKSMGISRDINQKNRSNTPNFLEFRKLCRKHTTHREKKRSKQRKIMFASK
jgi:ribosomal protein L33